MARFKVLGLNADRQLIRKLARRLAENDPEATRLRSVISRGLSGESPRKGGILAALCPSPLVDADIDVTRAIVSDRKVDS